MKIIRALVAAAVVAIGLVAFAPTASAANECEPYLGPSLFGARCVVEVGGVQTAVTPTVLDNGGVAVGGGVCTDANTNNPYCVHYLLMQGPGSFSSYDLCYGYPYGSSYVCLL